MSLNDLSIFYLLSSRDKKDIYVCIVHFSHFQCKSLASSIMNVSNYFHALKLIKSTFYAHRCTVYAIISRAPVNRVCESVCWCWIQLWRRQRQRGLISFITWERRLIAWQTNMSGPHECHIMKKKTSSPILLSLSLIPPNSTHTLTHTLLRSNIYAPIRKHPSRI